MCTEEKQNSPMYAPEILTYLRRHPGREAADVVRVFGRRGAEDYEIHEALEWLRDTGNVETRETTYISNHPNFLPVMRRITRWFAAQQTKPGTTD